MRYLRHHRPGAMLSAMNHANVVAIMARALARVPLRLVVSEHTTLTRSLAVALARERRLLQLVRRLYPWADVIVGVSDGVSQDLARFLGLPPGRVMTIYNPVVTDDLDARSHELLDHTWFEPGMPPVILAVGRLTPAKDFPNLIRAFAIVRARRPCRLVILGDGELRDALTALADELGVADDVSLPGFVSNPYAFMRRAGVFVLSSAWEGFGNVLAEAMACGARVVSTDCPSGPAEILQGGRWGRLVPVGDAQALAAAIDAALDDPVPPDVVTRARDFDADAIATMYLDVLKPIRD